MAIRVICPRKRCSSGTGHVIIACPPITVSSLLPSPLLVLPPVLEASSDCFSSVSKNSLKDLSIMLSSVDLTLEDLRKRGIDVC